MDTRRGPLAGIKVVEVAGLGPVPFCGMMLGDMGAEVVLVERPGASTGGGLRTGLERNRRRIELDLKCAAGIDVLLRLVARSDALFEGYRPGVAERMGWGPDVCLGCNPRLVYGRVSGWGREGPLAGSAGHDINYLALSGLLHAIGVPGGAPLPPLNVVGDFGGGGMLLAYGIVCALLEARISGRGQVVDAAMLDGSALFLAPFMGAAGNPWGFDPRPGQSLLGGAAPYYGVYETADGGYLAIGALEPQFFGALLRVLELDDAEARAAGFPALDLATRERAWPALRARIAARVRSRSREEWTQAFAAVDACVSPVLSLDEAVRHPQLRQRGTFGLVDGQPQPAPAPRFSRTPTTTPEAAREAGRDTAAVLDELGIDEAERDALRRAGAFGGEAP
ncbi:MAG: CaiB/BaiF CoA-transferase family protein [Steroidobacteraceae bacterium]